MGLLPKFVDDAAGPPAQAVGNTLANLWELGIGNHVTLWIKKQEVRQQQNLQDYIDKVENKTRNIPEEFLQEPPLNIVGPAIEASKYHIESEELREMFANLIASSIDSRRKSETHPSFVEIIKQLSPYDALILKNFKSAERIPLGQVRIAKDNGNFKIIHRHLMNFKDKENYKTQATGLGNLQRLGLLDIDYNAQSADTSEYDFLKGHPAYFEAEKALQDIQKTDFSFTKVDIQEGLCYRTPLCEDFINVCL